MQPYTVVNYIIATGKDTAVSVQDIVLGAQAIPLEIQYGGTGATNAEQARENLGAASKQSVTEIERRLEAVEAQATYTAMMTDTLLEV